MKTSNLEIAKKTLDGISPTWDIKDFVAVNPFFFQMDSNFSELIAEKSRFYSNDLLPSKRFFLDKLRAGKLKLEELENSVSRLQLSEFSSSLSQKDLIDFIESEEDPHIQDGLSICQLVDAIERTEQEASLPDTDYVSDFVQKQVSKWLSSYFDESQSTWRMPTRDLRLFSAWRELIVYDQDVSKSLKLLPSLLDSLPEKPEDVCEDLLSRIRLKFALNDHGIESYVYALASRNLGWISHIRKIEFEADRSGDKSKLKRSGGSLDLLAIQLCYDICYMAFLENFDGLKHLNSRKPINRSQQLKSILLDLYEQGLLKDAIDQFPKKDSPKVSNQEKVFVKAAFCIDVRSEPIRRAVESSSTKFETIGYAGFFGLPMSIRNFGHVGSDPQCPVLLESQFTLSERIAKPKESKKALQKIKDTVEAIYYKRKIQANPNSGFSFVETLGFTYIRKLLKAASGLVKPDIQSISTGLTEKQSSMLELDISSLDLQTKLELSKSVLCSMSFTKNYPKYVLLMGHGSESANNPYSSGLDCGACAGHQGLSNARAVAKMLNESAVRNDLKKVGLQIPDKSYFLSGWHNTTTDKLSVDFEKDFDASERQEIEGVFAKAQAKCKAERASLLENSLNSASDFTDIEFQRRANDWAEIRPEWGLSRNAFFYVGKREVCKNVNFDGRSFLHDYDWSEDEAFTVLEGIFTAPAVVANWINAQYYFSTVNPKEFGSGDKILHNVVGGIGCIPGNEGDLLQGLSKQSVWKNEDYFHEPVRLQIIVDAPQEALEMLMAKHSLVANLVNNSWLKLIQHNSKTGEFSQYVNGDWKLVTR